MTDQAWYQRAMARARNTQEPSPQRPMPSQQPVQWSNQSNQTFSQTPVSQQFVSTPQGPAPTSQKMGQASTTDLLQMQAATGHATPGVAHQLNPNACPSCGANLFYERLTKGPRRGPEPAPHCFSCGYNGLFEQGLAGNWGAS